MATYRIQFNPTFGFQEAKNLLPYLWELGISDIYASPIFKAKKGSSHGYDVVDPNQLNPELGTQEDFEDLVEELNKYGIGWIQDIVPNHMAYDSENLMLMDVLENGRNSHFFDYFDIEWDHTYEGLKGRVLAPFLGGFYGDCLENGEIKLKYDHSGFTINYHTLSFPLRIESYIRILNHKLGTLKRKLGGGHPDLIGFLRVIKTLKYLPSRGKAHERYDRIRSIKRVLWELYNKNIEIKGFIDGKIQAFKGTKGESRSFDLLDSLLSDQIFRLSYWKRAAEEINYRRFFNYNEFISLRMEDEKVFDHTHSLIFKLIHESEISGLRIDHVDGLYDPASYLKRVRERAGGIYMVVEKILDLKEELPPWPVQGTTGYDFMNHVNGVFCKMENENEFNQIYTSFAGLDTTYEDLLFEKKRMILRKYFAGDVDNLARLLKKISCKDRHGSDLTFCRFKKALENVLALFPVYRTYAGRENISQADRYYIKEAIKKAKEISSDLIPELDFIERCLLLKSPDCFADEEKKELFSFAMQFQQYTGALMAKGFEDTLLYIYNRFLSLNEVGGNPNKFGISITEFHDFNKKRADPWPHSMNATSTHDTKRGEDVRARINVLSEIPHEWGKNIKIWSKMNIRKKRSAEGIRVPDRNEEYFLYQTLVGAFPFHEKDHPAFADRLKSYMIKAIREAKVHSSGPAPNMDYEEAITSFIEKILKKDVFLDSFLLFQKKVAFYGLLNSLSQALLKMTSPGMPDFYQGTELWDMNLVDPDNRRPVDFEKRKEFLHEIKEKEKKDILGLIKELIFTREDGRVKLFLIHRLLMARRENAMVFQNGSYIPIEAAGKFKDHVVAFARKKENSWAITIAPRLLTPLVDEEEFPVGRHVWDDTHILVPDDAPPSWRDAVTGQEIKGGKTMLMGEVLQHFPAALLMGEKNEGNSEGKAQTSHN